MIKIKMLDKGIPTAKFGFLVAGSTKEVNEGLANHLIKMKAAVAVDAPKVRKKRTVKKADSK